MEMIHDDPADGQHERAAADDDQRVREKLRTGIVQDVVPCPLKRGENVDEQ